MGCRILIIEDNQTNLELMVYLLNAFGHTPLVAMDGEEGIAVAARELPDLIISDMQMPKMDGYGVASYLKNHPELKKIPLIAVTAFAMVGDRDKMLAGGFDGYIPKPITPETFVREVEAFLPSGTPSSVPPAPVWETTFPAESLPGTGETILVVDDSPMNLELMQSTLKPFGYRIITATSVRKGLEIAREIQPDIILSDLHLPDEDGYDFIKAVKANPQFSSIPFAFISSTVWGESEKTVGLSLGATLVYRAPD